MKPSIEEPPKLKLKVLPRHIHYDFLGRNNTLLIIITNELLDWKVEALVDDLKCLLRSLGRQLPILLVFH